MSELSNKILEIVRDHTTEKVDVALSSRLYHDLLIWGDDVDELFDDLVNEFDCDFSDFEFNRFFRCEGSLGIDPLMRLRRRWGLLGNKTPVTVQHLVHVAENGKWIDPVIGDATTKPTDNTS